jgi:hypothetical protein
VVTQLYLQKKFQKFLFFCPRKLGELGGHSILIFLKKHENQTIVQFSFTFFFLKFFFWLRHYGELGGHPIHFFLRRRVLSFKRGHLGSHSILMKDSSLMQKKNPNHLIIFSVNSRWENHVATSCFLLKWSIESKTTLKWLVLL